MKSLLLGMAVLDEEKMIQPIKIYMLIFLFCQASLSMHGGRILKTMPRFGQKLPAACLSFHIQKNYKAKFLVTLPFLALQGIRYYILERKLGNIQSQFDPTWEQLRSILKKNVREIYPDQAQAILEAWDQDMEIYRMSNPEGTPRKLLADIKQCTIKLNASLKKQIINAFEDRANKSIKKPSQLVHSWLTK